MCRAGRSRSSRTPCSTSLCGLAWAYFFGRVSRHAQHALAVLVTPVLRFAAAGDGAERHRAAMFPWRQPSSHAAGQEESGVDAQWYRHAGQYVSMRWALDRRGVFELARVSVQARASTCAAPRRGRQVRSSAGRRLGRTSSYLGHWRLCSAPSASGTAGSTCLCGMRPSWADGASPGRRSMLIGTCKKSWRWPESLSMSLIVRAGSFSAMWGEMQAARRRSWSGAGSEAGGDHAPWCCAVARARRGTGLCPAAGGWNHDNSSTNSNTGWPGR